MTIDHPTCRPSSRRLAWLLLAGVALLGAGGAEGRPERLTSRPRPAVQPATETAVGAEIRTQIGQRRRILLPGGSILYVNQNTTVKLDAARRLTLSAGEVFVEAAPQRGQDAFLVLTPKRAVT